MKNFFWEVSARAITGFVYTACLVGEVLIRSTTHVLHKLKIIDWTW